ncbi:MAG: acyl-CoA dehydrogenase family protein [Acetobacteraceae bacterium]|nr:acyl-CoA dehydrogenase family protein [Acetobacteraceae bacterium]
MPVSTLHQTTRAQPLGDPLARARALGPLVAEASDAIEREQRIPPSLLDALHAARLFRLLLPRSAGGEESEPGPYLRAVEEIGRHDGSVAWCMFVANSAGLIAAYLEPASARAIFADPRAAIAWGPPGADRARGVPGGYRVSGRWSYASGCRHATWMGAHCMVEEPDGSLRLNDAGRPTVRTLLFPAERARLIDDWDVIGLRGTSSGSYALDDLFVPETYSSTREDPALARERGRLYAIPQQGLYTVGAAGTALGIARGMMDAFLALATRKTPRALGLSLARSPAVQMEFAQVEARLGAARAYLLATLEEIWSDPAPRAPISVPDRARLRLAATHAIQCAVEAADWTYRAAGTDAIFTGSPFERRFRDIHTVSQQIQARMANFEAVGRVMMGIEPETPFL